MKTKQRRRGSQDAQYAKRQAGLRMLLSGNYRQADIAAALGVAHGTVRGWSSKLNAGQSSVKKQAVRGRPKGVGRILTKAEEHKVIATIRDKNPQQMHMDFYLWSLGAVMALIEKLFGKSLSESGVRKYLSGWGFTVQRPATRYSSRDDVLVQGWMKEVYPVLALRAKAEGAEIHWLDEAGLNNQAVYQRGFAPRGQPPVTTRPAKHEKISMISSVTHKGTMRFSLYEGGLKAPVLIGFLENLLRGATQKVFVIMDNLPVHKGKAVQAWLAEYADRIEVFYLPPYAPDLKPDEYLNNDLKQNVPATQAFPSQNGH